MNTAVKLGIVAALVIVVGVVIALKGDEDTSGSDASPKSAVTAATPRLLDLGSVSCIPCKMMA
ncbi:MAG TPA: thioredoxin, partial [Planctomycetota bacterium]|nr:thioredoxin [Planctomycetota bacterium]